MIRKVRRGDGGEALLLDTGVDEVVTGADDGLGVSEERRLRVMKDEHQRRR